MNKCNPLTVLALLALLLLPLPTLANTVLVLGDSLSAGYGLQDGEGWVHLLDQRLQKTAPGWSVVNASISGDTTSNGLQRLPASLKQSQPQIVIIELGGNDGLRGTQLPIIKQNLIALVKQAQAAGAKVLLMEMRIPPNYGKKYTERFTGQYSEIAEETGATLVPFFLREVGGRNELMQADGIHPNASGQPKMLDAMWPLLQQVAKLKERK
ncbi:arylesterase [Permianibacter sp. IMCC34836]|uniref:arylesterase n=1 Tax=Permianibacter fluminis TaxID=2738515 RepID=UPI0015560F2F|nr:arylesterase [Permianibacter fluminis]NQD38769.1 arylesterase [Permianibacter fluminis]